ncbi:MAG: NAD(P)/FAD-dependent oxidoreductase [Actinomycetia bacterium]|nr:NAD(P)/FAD-dependent oxidoreductase [Actinomycetes bacterium]
MADTQKPRDVDILIVGAGLSGIGAAYRFQTECPTKTYEILEGRDAIGGTWDLFRYPGIRSDSDMYTLGYPFRPWREAKAIADGDDILAYVRSTAAEYGIDRRIQYQHQVTAANWSTQESRWHVAVQTPQGQVEYVCQFLYLCCGYYDYRAGHDAGIPGLADFQGEVVHPQFWPDELDYQDKDVVVIGSGATAVTLVPALAPNAKHVTMLQRSPTYIVNRPSKDSISDFLRDKLPERRAHGLARWKNILTTTAFYRFCRRFPDQARKLLLAGVRQELPDGYDVEKNFNPTYQPWDERLCLVPDGDLFQSLTSGKADVVTDHIERVTGTGIQLRSGASLPADIVITATGLKIRVGGGIEVSVDGQLLDIGDVLVYRGVMLSGVPNLGWCVGYTNASWTLRTDISTRFFCRLINRMDVAGYAQATPTPPADVDPQPLIDLTSGYLQRAKDELPKQGSRAPWYLRQDYVLDSASLKFAKLDKDMAFR